MEGETIPSAAPKGGGSQNANQYGFTNKGGNVVAFANNSTIISITSQDPNSLSLKPVLRKDRKKYNITIDAIKNTEQLADVLEFLASKGNASNERMHII